MRRNLLAGLRRMRKRRDLGRLSGGRNRPSGSFARLRPDRPDGRLCSRPDFRLPSQSRGQPRPLRGGPFPGARCRALCRRPARRGDRRRLPPSDDRVWESGIRSRCRRSRSQRLCGRIARRLHARIGLPHRAGPDRRLPLSDRRRQLPRSAARLRPDRHRARLDPHPPDQHPDHQHIGKSGPKHRSGSGRRRPGPFPALAVLGRAAARGSGRRPARPCAVWHGRTRSGPAGPLRSRSVKHVGVA